MLQLLQKWYPTLYHDTSVLLFLLQLQENEGQEDLKSTLMLMVFHKKRSLESRLQFKLHHLVYALYVIVLSNMVPKYSGNFDNNNVIEDEY